MAALETRHLADLSFSEVSRALRALSSTYVERRERIGEGAALSGAGKRSAFALFYGPLHYLLVREIVESLNAASGVKRLVDVGCGTGASGAAWARAGAKGSDESKDPAVLGLDLHPWALQEAAWTYRHFGLRARTSRVNLSAQPLPRERSAWLCAFTLNELVPAARDSVITQLFERHKAGASVLIVEPLAGFVAPWWAACRRQVEEAGGRADEWRFPVELPAIVAKLDRAAGLNHRTVTGRSFWLP